MDQKKKNTRLAEQDDRLEVEKVVEDVTKKVEVAEHVTRRRRATDERSESSRKKLKDDDDDEERNE